MAVKLRLMRVGKTKQPVYRVVASDARSPRDGRFIEIIGQYNPRQQPSLIVIDNHKAVKWLQSGAQATDRVEKLLKISGAWDSFKAGILPEPQPKVHVQQTRPVYIAPEPKPAPVKVEAAVVSEPAETVAVAAPAEAATAETAPAETAVHTLADTTDTTDISTTETVTETAAAVDAHEGEAVVHTTVSVTTIVDGVETTEVIEQSDSYVAADSVVDYNPDTTDTTVIRKETIVVDGKVVDSTESITSEVTE
jgi:small subunit ribosomal protein S16